MTKVPSHTLDSDVRGIKRLPTTTAFHKAIAQCNRKSCWQGRHFRQTGALSD